MTFGGNQEVAAVLRSWIAALGLVLSLLWGAVAGLFGPALLWGNGLIMAATLFLWWWYPARYASTLRGHIDQNALYIVSGVWFRRETYVPFEAIRAFECWTLPFERLWRCRTVVLRVAGGTVFLLLLPQQQAADLLNWLEQTGRE